MIVIGLVGPSWGPALVPARAQFHLGTLAAGTLLLAFGAFRTAGSALAGAISDHLPRRTLLAAYGAILCTALLAEAAAPSWPAVVAGGGGIGFAFGCLATEINAVAAAGSGPNAGRRRARDLNLVNAAYGLGASLGPLVLGLLLATHHGWRLAFVLWAALAVVPLAGLGAVSPPATRRARPAPVGLNGPVLLLCGMAFLYNGIGWTIAAWAPTWMLARFGAQLLTGAAASTAFYVFLTAGRLGAAALAARLGPGRLLWWEALVAGLALISLFVAPGAPWALAAFAVAGLALGGVYPGLVAQATALWPDRPGAMSGLVATGGAIGVSLLPFAAGAAGGLGGPVATGWLLPLGGVALIALARAASRVGSRSAA